MKSKTDMTQRVKIELEGYIIWHEDFTSEEECGCGSPYHFEIPGLSKEYFDESGMFGSNMNSWERDQFEPIDPHKGKFRLTIEPLGELDESMLNPST